MVDIRRLFGNAAEDFAARFLKAKGYKILERQFTTRFGEIDLVAKDGNEIVFVDVKARKNSAFGYPEESVTRAKIEKIQVVAETYLQKKHMLHSAYRIDVISIEYTETDPKIHHFIAVS